MPIYTIQACEYNVPRHAVILDTNVLVAAFCDKDDHYKDARWFVDECDQPFIVPFEVLVEAWGMIVGSYGDWEGGVELLAWLGTPGNADLLVQSSNCVENTSDMIRSIHIDCVDALISHLGNDISRTCDFNPHIAIATYDTADITRCRSAYSLQVRVLDMRSLDYY